MEYEIANSYDLAKTLKECRINQGITQTEMALKSDFRQPQLSSIEKGDRQLLVDTLLKYLDNINGHLYIKI